MLSKITSWRHSKIIAFVLAVAVFLTAFYGLVPVISLAEATDAPAPQAETVVGYWDGDKTYDYTQMEGKGTEDEPYKVYNGAQLYAAVTCDEEKWFVLMNDIVLQPDAATAAKVAALIEDDSNPDTAGLKNWATSFTNTDCRNNNNQHFAGHLDGNHHTVSCLYSERTGSFSVDRGIGFIEGATNGASVENLILDTLYIKSFRSIGGIFGVYNGNNTSTRGYITACVVRNSKFINTNDTVKPAKADDANIGYSISIGGLVGRQTWTGKVTASYCVVNNVEMVTTCLDADDGKNYGYLYTGGLTGYAGSSGTTFSQCLSFDTSYPYPYWGNAGTIYTDTANPLNFTTVAGINANATCVGAQAYDFFPGFSPAFGWIVPDDNSTLMYVGPENVSKYDYVTPVWDGTHTVTVDSLAGGDGTTAETAKLVSTGSELWAAAKCTTEVYFKLINDIDLQNADGMQIIANLKAGTTTDATGLNNWRTAATFIGHIDGNGHTVKGLALYNADSDTATNGFGFISRASGTASIKNLTLDSAYITAKGYTGGIVGMVRGSGATPVIEGCNVINSKFVNTRSDAAEGYNSVAGIAGCGYQGTSTTINNCTVINTELTQTTSDGRRGGMVGDFWAAKPSISNCIVEGYPVHAYTSVQVTNYTNVYTTVEGSKAAADGTTATVLTPEKIKGGVAYENVKLTPAHGWIVKDADSYPVYVGTENALKAEYVTPIWNGNTSLTVDSLAGGDGTSAETAKLVTTGSELYAAMKCTTEVYFKLINDIQLQTADGMTIIDNLKAGTTTDTTGLNNWYKSTDFIGHFDGGFHTVTGMAAFSTTDSNNGLGFVSRIKGTGSIKNITLDSAYITGQTYIGGIFGRTSGGTPVIDGCSVINSKFVNTRANAAEGYNAVAGIAGCGYTGTSTTISNCTVLNTQLSQTTSDGRCAGIAGDFWAAQPYISNCIVEGYAVQGYGTSQVKNYTNVYTTVSGSKTAADGTTVTVATAAQLKGTELTGINASTGWEIKENAFPVYTGVKGTRPSNTTTVWNGIKPTSWTGLDGEGTEDEPYLIYNGAELYAAVNCTTANTYFKLMNDIQLQTDVNMEELAKLIDNDADNDPSDDVKATFNSWLYKTSAFYGHIDGNFKTVSGLYLSGTTEGSTGLGFISRAAGGTSISNLTLDSMYITGVNKIGGFIGLVYGGSGGVNLSACVLKNSKLHNTSTNTDKQTFGSVAGLVAGHWSGDVIAIENSSVYDVALISDNGTCAGMTGANVGSTAAHTNKNSISVGYKPSANANIKHTNVYTTANDTYSGVRANLTKEQLQGEDVLLGGIRPLMGWEFAEGEYPKYTGKQGTETTNSVTYWNGIPAYTIDEFEGQGTGDSADDPILIRHGFELYAALQNTEGKHFKLVNDIYLNTEARANDWNLWESNKAFTGTFDGNGHTIYNMEEIFDKGADNSGAKNGIALIPTAANATVKNLHLRGVEVNSWTTSGTAALVGSATGDVNIERCSITDANIGGRRTVSGFVGKTADGVAITIKDSVLADSVLTKHAVSSDIEYYAGAFVGNGSTATNITLTDVVAKGYVAVGASAEGAVAGTNDYAIVSGGDYANVAAFKAALANGTAQLSTEFYYDYLSGNLPMLKNRLATQNVDIDGNEGADLDADDALALKNILLYGSDAQLTLSEDNANGYNGLAGVDITDLVALAKKNK